MPELFLAALGVVLLILLLQKLEYAETKLLVKTLKWTLAGLMVLAAIYLTLVGRLLHVAALFVLLILLLKQDAQHWIRKNSPPPSLRHPMTKREAAALLKVKINATPEEIQKAFKTIKPKDSTHQDLLLHARDLLLEKKRSKKRPQK